MALIEEEEYRKVEHDKKPPLSSLLLLYDTVMQKKCDEIECATAKAKAGANAGAKAQGLTNQK